jgi:ribose transport system ATP-binding protein
MPALLEIRNLTKNFPGIIALNNVSMVINRGEIHALMGENGAGKSTLVKIITSVYRPDAGEIVFKGKSLLNNSPAEIHSLGISVVYQDVNLVSELNVAENIYLGRLPVKSKFLFDRNALFKNSLSILKGLELDFSPRVKVKELSALNQRMVAIARCLSFNPDLIIMDEPTSALSQLEIDTLFEKIRKLQKQGVTILYISHFLEEVFAVANAITVLRDGKKVDTVNTSQVSPEDIVFRMVGHKVKYEKKPSYNLSQNKKIFEAKNISNVKYFSNISFDLFEGEILGITGPAGSGKTAIARTIFGIDRIDGGEMTIFGKNTLNNNPADAINNQIGYIPQDRHKEGLWLGTSIVKNISLPSLNRLSSYGFINRQAEKRLAQNFSNKLSIKSRSLDMQVEFLSGGNQQKVSIVKWLALNPRILILDEPTQGIDIATKQEIFQLIRNLSKSGMAVIYLSSEPTELANLCHRILIMRKGKIVETLEGKEINRPRIIREITGAKGANHQNA